MRTGIQALMLAENEREALVELRRRLLAHPDIDSLVLFGSVARGEAEEGSDTDILVLTRRRMDHWERHDVVTDLVCQINLAHDTNISTFVVHKDEWDGLLRYSGIRAEIERDGVPL